MLRVSGGHASRMGRSMVAESRCSARRSPSASGLPNLPTVLLSLATGKAT